MSRPKIYILGAGGQARVNISLIKESNEFIHLYKSYIEFSIPNYFATVIDKKNFCNGCT